MHDSTLIQQFISEQVQASLSCKPACQTRLEGKMVRGFN